MTKHMLAGMSESLWHDAYRYLTLLEEPHSLYVDNWRSFVGGTRRVLFREGWLLSDVKCEDAKGKGTLP